MLELAKELADGAHPFATTPEHTAMARKILGPGKLLRRLLQADRIGSVIFYGPPGTGKTALARVPVAGRGVEQYLPQAVVLQAAGQLLGREVVGEQVFDGLEAVARGGLEAVKKIQVVVEHGQVGGEAGHEGFPENGC